MAKPFALPDPPGPGGGGASSSGAGPPAGTGPSHANQAGPHPGYPAPHQQYQQPPQSAPPIVSHGTGGAFPMVGPGGHAASTPIPVTGGNNHYYHHYAHHHPQPLYHQPHPYYHGHYQGSPYAHPVGPASAGGNPADPPQHPLPHVMTPPNSAFAHPPHHGPANGELVQALYEALHLCGVRESPPTPLSRSPPSASCSPPATGGFCAPPQTFFPHNPSAPASAPPVRQNGGRMFFHPSTPGPGAQYPRPPSQPTPLSANSHSSSSGISSSLDTPSCSSGTPHYVQSQAQPVLFNWQDDGDSSESEGGTSSSQATSSSGCSSYCYGLDESESSSMAGSLTPSSAGVASPAPSGVTVHGVVPPHLDTYMARRDQLQEFPGKIPQRKRRSRTPKPKKSRFLEKPLMWQMAVTAALIALGCGYFAGR